MDIRKIINILENTGNTLDQKPPFEWNSKTIVWTNGTYAISVDDIDDARYVAVWTADNKCAGKLTTTGGTLRGEYLGISMASLDPKHRGKRLGYLMYLCLLKYLGTKWKGISTYLPDQVNTKQVPKIWNRLGAYNPDGNLDYLVVDKDKFIDL